VDKYSVCSHEKYSLAPRHIIVMTVFVNKRSASASPRLSCMHRGSTNRNRWRRTQIRYPDYRNFDALRKRLLYTTWPYMLDKWYLSFIQYGGRKRPFYWGSFLPRKKGGSNFALFDWTVSNGEKLIHGVRLDPGLELLMKPLEHLTTMRRWISRHASPIVTGRCHYLCKRCRSSFKKI